MSITNRDDLIEVLSRLGVIGAARNGDLDSLIPGGSSGTVSSSDITDATTVGKGVLTAANQAAARTAIGAGTSSLVVGATSTTAKAGNYKPTLAEIESAVVGATTVAAPPQDTDTLLIIRGGKVYTVTMKQISDYMKVPG